jgi:catechol 2,3-dioxygenase-like lactoylglutathione lyase family enzyme
MTREARLGDQTVRSLRAFVPAKDFELSKRFYADLGFEVHDIGPALASVSAGAHSFFLQDSYVPHWADNCMLYLLVDDLGTWWDRIQAADLPGRYGVRPPRAPTREPWGHDVVHVVDPSGVLWHIAAEPSA